MNLNKVLGLIVVFVFSSIVFSGCTGENGSTNTDVNAWLTGYTPVHGVGSGEDDFWTTYPDINPNASQPVSHVTWLLHSLQEKSTVFVVHKTGCAACTPQAERIIALGEKYPNYLATYDLDLTLGGETEQKGYDTMIYDPDGPPSYIALTGIFTLINVNGSVTYGWHSWEGDVPDAEMKSWIKDCIYYYSVNSEQ